MLEIVLAMHKWLQSNEATIVDWQTWRHVDMAANWCWHHFYYAEVAA